ncbi:MAG: AraC family transcriptional regulator [Limnohabitans sp.]|uniref:helix-turn-helix domain-containing protein n=1 Tax=Limnohabitans sp. TaxID=1907725 RepID=UPI0030E084D2
MAELATAVKSALHENWTTERMAARFALSAPQFHTRWRQLTGQTPQTWLRDLRLDEAERLLRAGLLVDAAAAQVGYASSSSLLYALRRERGLGSRALRAD